MLAIALMLSGIGLVATLAASISAYFVQQDKLAEAKTIEDRLERIERLLDRLSDSAGAGVQLERLHSLPAVPAALGERPSNPGRLEDS
jgi:hypothetical protein